MKENIRKLFFMLLLFFVFSINTTAKNKEEVLFSRCVDGDTARFLLNNEEITVRFLAIDTPETKHPNIKPEPFGQEASDFTCDELSNAQNILLEFDDGSDKTDKYNRYLAWIWVDDNLLQEKLLEEGLAKVNYIYGDYLYTDALYEIEDNAKINKIGIWSDEVPTYNITFIFDEKTIVKEVVYNDKVSVFIPNKEGYNFKRWINGKEEFDFNTRINKDLTLTAEFEKKITFTDVLLIIIASILLYLTNKSNFKKKLKKLI